MRVLLGIWGAAVVGILPASASILYVPDHYTTIQEAIDAAAEGDEVVIRPDTYGGPGNQDLSFDGKAITVRSETGLSGNVWIDPTGTSRGFIFYHGETESSILEGIVVIDGGCNDPAYMGGAIMCSFGSPTIRNCEFLNCRATGGGGGLACYSGQPSITNCTFENNESVYLGSYTPGGSLWCNDGANPILTNCVLWGGQPDEIDHGSSAPTITYSAIAGGWTGEGNISTDPLINSWFGLLEGSPCIDAGNNLAVPLDLTDLDGDGDTSERIPLDFWGGSPRSGDPRFMDDPETVDTGVPDPPDYPQVVDMGACEFQPAATNFSAAQYYDAGAGPSSVDAADLDGDGNPDLAVADSGSDTAAILMGLGDGGFSGLAYSEFNEVPQGVSFGDINGDAHIDLAVSLPSTDQVALLSGNGDGTFGYPAIKDAGDGPNTLAFGDLNGDDLPDIVIANRWSDDLAILISEGGGSFEPTSYHGVGGRPRSLALADLTGDHILDCVVGLNSTATIKVLPGVGDGRFGSGSTYSVGYGPMSVAVGDLNRDLLPDVVVASPTAGNISVLLGLGGGSLDAAVVYTAGVEPHAIAIGEFNGDTWPDLAVANRGSDDVAILYNQSNGVYGPPEFYDVGVAPEDLVVVDLDDDDALDIVTANNGSDDIAVLLGNIPVPATAPDVLCPSLSRLALHVWPNPVFSGTTILFDLPRPGRVNLQLFGSDGRLVKTVLQGHREAGPLQLNWRAADGRTIDTGVYLLRLEVNGDVTSRRLMFLN